MNRTRPSPLPRRSVLIGAWLFPLAMLAVGSFADYPVSLALYQGGNLPGRILAGFGVYPVILALTAVGAMLLSACSHRSLAADLCCRAASGILIGAGIWAGTVVPPRYCDIPVAASGVISAVCAVLTLWGVLHLCRGADKRMVLRVAAAFLLVVLADLVVVNLIKIPWGRPRMRLIAAHEQVYFMPWWRPGTALRDTITPLGIAAEEFKSFPSGHTANASALLLLTLLPMIRPSLMRWQTALFFTGFGWAVLVAFSRIVMGAHFMTDTAVGLSVGLCALVVVCRFLFPPQTREGGARIF